MLLISSDGFTPRFVSTPLPNHGTCSGIALADKHHNYGDVDSDSPVKVTPLEYSQYPPTVSILHQHHIDQYTLCRAQVIFRKLASRGKMPFETIHSTTIYKTPPCVVASCFLMYLGCMSS